MAFVDSTEEKINLLLIYEKIYFLNVFDIFSIDLDPIIESCQLNLQLNLQSSCTIEQYLV